MKKLLTLFVVGAVVMMAGSVMAQPLTIQNMIGDNDGYGYGAGVVADGADLPGAPSSWTFDNRSAAELAATDGSQATDVEDNFDVTFFHTFDVSQFAVLSSATFTIDITGVQQGVFGGTSKLYLDGVQVLDQTLNQGAWGSNLFTFNVNLADLADGALDVYFDNWGSDHMGIDFTMLEVNGRAAVPEPTTMLLFGLGMLGAGAYRRYKK